MRTLFFAISAVLFAADGMLAYFWSPAIWGLAALVPLFILGLCDILQKKHSIRRNFPVIGHGRYLLEHIRPEINQYFVESNWDGMPFNRSKRSVVYQRAKGVTDTVPFGTQTDVYETGYEWINHSLVPKPVLKEEPRVRIGGKDCRQPYFASVFNVSAMSYGSLSSNAVRALNRGAKLGGFYHNTGEGGLSPYHLEDGGDIVWQIGTGYFGCRDAHGNFDEENFRKRATLPQVKMIELKLSQGAKPGHGGILPAAKVTEEIAEIRGVAQGKDVLSPPAHSAFSTPRGLLEFLARLRELSGGKPVGFKLCLGKHREFLGICKAMLQTGILPDFITVDGGEGGTGAAPMEFADSIGTPLNDGLIFIHNSLVGIGVRDQIKIICSGKITTGFAIASKLALGADLCNSARGMMFAIGCIQALRCNNNTCPTGVATQDPDLVKGLDVGDKSVRVKNFHHATVHSFFEVIAAAGLSHPSELRPWHIQRRVSAWEVKHYGEMYPYIEAEALLRTEVPQTYARPWAAANAESFS
ncbi:MAG: FMN-binding glutamate synthase family protein [Bdellovibrionia bacterium]